MVNLANSYRQTGDETSAQAVLQMVMNLGQRYGNGTPPEYLIGQLVGISVERMALGAMNPNSLYGDNGQTVQDYLNQITQQREALKQLKQQLQPVLPMMSDQDWISYTDRMMLSGEQAAMKWVINKYGQK